MTFFQITPNEVISGICRAINGAFEGNLSIYKEKQDYLELPAVTVQCIDYDKRMERFDKFVNNFNIIINYFPNDSVIIKNKRMEMFSVAEKIVNAVTYINLPAYTKTANNEYTEITLPCRGYNFDIKEKDGFIQIGVMYTVRTKKTSENTQTKMSELQITINDNC